MSCVTCQVSCVRCLVSCVICYFNLNFFFLFLGQSDRASRWRVWYQRSSFNGLVSRYIWFAWSLHVFYMTFSILFVIWTCRAQILEKKKTEKNWWREKKVWYCSTSGTQFFHLCLAPAANSDLLEKFCYSLGHLIFGLKWLQNCQAALFWAFQTIRLSDFQPVWLSKRSEYLTIRLSDFHNAILSYC